MAAKGQKSDEDETPLLQATQHALNGFKAYLRSFDGGKRAAKTANMYAGIMAKVLRQECNGNIECMKALSTWSQPNGVLQKWCQTKAPTAVQQYLYALKSFLDYMQWCPRKFIPMTAPNFAKVKKQLANWITSIRKERGKQAMKRVSKTQSELPEAAKKIANYQDSEHYR